MRESTNAIGLHFYLFVATLKIADFDNVRFTVTVESRQTSHCQYLLDRRFGTRCITVYMPTDSRNIDLLPQSRHSYTFVYTTVKRHSRFEQHAVLRQLQAVYGSLALALEHKQQPQQQSVFSLPVRIRSERYLGRDWRMGRLLT